MAQESQKHTDSAMQSEHERPTTNEDIVSQQHHQREVESKKPADEFQARIKEFRIKHAVIFKQEEVAVSVPTLHCFQGQEQCRLGWVVRSIG